MQSEANALACKLREEYKLSENGYKAIERIIYAMTGTTAHSINDADVWLGTLLELFAAGVRREQREADYTRVHTGYNLSGHKVYAVYEGKRKVGEISHYDNGVWYWRRRGAIVECDSMNEALESLSEFDKYMVASGIREGE